MAARSIDTKKGKVYHLTLLINTLAFKHPLFVDVYAAQVFVTCSPH